MSRQVVERANFSGIYTGQGICMIIALISMSCLYTKQQDDWLMTAIVFIGYIGGTYACCALCKSIFTFICGIAFAAIVPGIVAGLYDPESVKYGMLFGAGFGFFTAWRVAIGRHYEIIE